MATDPTFDMFHKYNKLVRRGLAPKITCKACKTPMITRLGPGDSLVLFCFICDTTTDPGQATLDKVRAVVSEHFIDKVPND